MGSSTLPSQIISSFLTSYTEPIISHVVSPLNRTETGDVAVICYFSIPDSVKRCCPVHKNVRPLTVFRIKCVRSCLYWTNLYRSFSLAYRIQIPHSPHTLTSGWTNKSSPWRRYEYQHFHFFILSRYQISPTRPPKLQ